MIKLGASRQVGAHRKKRREEEDLSRRPGRPGASPAPLVLLAVGSSPMQPIEFALFVAVVALAAGLIGSLVWPFTARPAGRRRATPRTARGRARSRAAAPRAQASLPRLPPRVRAPGFSSARTTRAIWSRPVDPAARATAPGVTCPNCRRSFDAAKRFCAFDGEELVPLSLALGSATGGPALGTTGMSGISAVGGCRALRTWPALPARRCR